MSLNTNLTYVLYCKNKIFKVFSSTNNKYFDHNALKVFENS